MNSKKSEFKKINAVVDLENKCEEIYDKLKSNPDYAFTEDDSNYMKDTIEFYMDPKKLLEDKFLL